MTVKILAVDDSATMRKILGMTFAGEDAVVVTASSAEEALTKARQAPPDVVFADAALAGTDGYALASALKSDPALANTAVILLASQHHPFDEGKGRASGVDDHVAKPFDTQVVLDKVADVMRRPRRAASTPAMAAPAPAPAAPPAPPPAAPARKQTMAFGAPPVPPPPAPPAPPAAKPVLELAEEEVVPGPAPAARPVAAPKPAPAAPARTFAAPPKPAPAPAAAPAKPASRPAMPAVAAAAVDSGMAAKLEGLGLTKEQIEGVLALSREVVEQVVWEVVPDLAETLIREEIQRLTRE